MSKNNKNALLFLLLVLAGGGAWLYNNHQAAQKPSIILSNINPEQGTVAFKMGYQGESVEGTAYRGQLFQKQEGDVSFMYSQLEQDIVFYIHDKGGNSILAKRAYLNG